MGRKEKGEEGRDLELKECQCTIEVLRLTFLL